jgi:hypothetical protein
MGTVALAHQVQKKWNMLRRFMVIPYWWMKHGAS